MDNATKARENRLRAMARRQGFRLVKNPRRDARATDYGSYMLVNPDTEAVVADFGWDCPGWNKPGNSHLDDVEDFLNRERHDTTTSTEEEEE
jgi:hypothetical protein